METTCGSFALKDHKASEDAAIATMLKDAGCIVIGLANLSVRLLIHASILDLLID